MTPEDLNQMSKVTSAQLQAHQAKFAEILREEKRLRVLLEALAKDERIGNETSHNDAAYKSVRADVAWNRWVGQSRMALQSELSSLMVRKERALAALQVSFGRADVIDRLKSDALGAKQKGRHCASLEGYLLPFISGIK